MSKAKGLTVTVVSMVNAAETGRQEVQVNEGTIINVMQEVYPPPGGSIEGIQVGSRVEVDHEPELDPDSGEDEPTCSVCGRHMDMVWIHGGSA